MLIFLETSVVEKYGLKPKNYIFELETLQAYRILIIAEADVLLAFLRSRHHLIANASLVIEGHEIYSLY